MLSSDDGVEKWRLDHEMCRTLRVRVSIVCIRKIFKNCISLLVSKNRTQKLIIKRSYLNNRESTSFRICASPKLCNILIILVYSDLLCLCKKK